jgi:uncharacterized membrane protein YkoI
MKTNLIIMAATGLLLMGCKPGVETASQKFNELPPAVQKTVRAQAPNAEIANVSHETRDGVEVYAVEFREPDRNPKIEVAADGRLLNTDMVKPAGTLERALTPTGATGTKLSALPESAQKTILAKVPSGEVVGISRHEKAGQITYEVEFTQKGTNWTIRVAQDGTLVQDRQEKKIEPISTAPTP